MTTSAPDKTTVLPSETTMMEKTADEDEDPGATTVIAQPTTMMEAAPEEDEEDSGPQPTTALNQRTTRIGDDTTLIPQST